MKGIMVNQPKSIINLQDHLTRCQTLPETGVRFSILIEVGRGVGAALASTQTSATDCILSPYEGNEGDFN